jgi:anti-sigma factor RsiW
MSQHILEWLPAYHDGELSTGRRQQVEKHLQTCPDCRAELQAVADLSALLKSDQSPRLTSAERFAAQVQLRLLHSSPQEIRSDRLTPRWVLGAPLLLLIGWAFLQAALLLTAFILGTDWGLGLQSLLWPNWVRAENLLETIGSLVALNLGLLVLTASLWSVWLAFWWVWNRSQNLETGTDRI